MKTLVINDLRRIQLEILDEIHDFCGKHGLVYSLCGGTMLGAVRHKGYIPWDDDIDLMMPRSDYERFKAEFSSSLNEVIDLSKIETCEEQFIKVSRKGTWMEDIILRRRLYGVNVDIFPIDGMPEDFKPYTNVLRTMHQAVVESCPSWKAATRHKFYWFLRFQAKRLLRGRAADVLELKANLEKEALEHLPQDFALATVIYGDFRIFPFPSDVFFHIQDIEFEGKMYKCIRDTDLYLRTVYGDYMTLPPVEKQVSHHLYDSYQE